MASASMQKDGRPPPAEVRAQVQRMTASDVFTTSPQLSAFLVFVVEAVLRGRGERLKGYTIGVEVLRRDPNFDPQLDPIVRVEATRLRRAIERYYAGAGTDDAVIIELPRGGYVPRFSWRAEASAVTPGEPQPAIVLKPGNGMPTLRVAPFVVVGTPDTRVIVAETLSSKICEAFALFEIINVTVAAPPGARNGPGAAASRSDYRLDGTVDYRGNGLVDLRFKLIDESDATVIWSRAFEKLSEQDNGAAERKIILELATAIVQPFGVISANDRTKRLGTDALDPRYSVLIEAGDALRSFDPKATARARAGLERLTALDSNFAAGFSILAALYGREYLTGFGARPRDTPPLERALRAARRGIELKPQSARAYHILFSILFFRGETAAAIATAEKAMALNPFDVLIVSEFAGRLIYVGEVARGMTMLRDAVGYGAILPSWSHFSLFVGHYLRGEMAEARSQASQLTTETYVYGQFARALLARLDGDGAELRRAKQAIVALQPAWADDPRRELGKLINAPDIADRLMADVGTDGFRDASNA